MWSSERERERRTERGGNRQTERNREREREFSIKSDVEGLYCLIGPHLTSWIPMNLFINHSQENLHKNCSIPENPVRAPEYPTRAPEIAYMYI